MFWKNFMKWYRPIVEGITFHDVAKKFATFDGYDIFVTTFLMRFVYTFNFHGAKA